MQSFSTQFTPHFGVESKVCCSCWTCLECFNKKLRTLVGDSFKEDYRRESLCVERECWLNYHMHKCIFLYYKRSEPVRMKYKSSEHLNAIKKLNIRNLQPWHIWCTNWPWMYCFEHWPQVLLLKIWSKRGIWHNWSMIDHTKSIVKFCKSIKSYPTPLTLDCIFFFFIPSLPPHLQPQNQHDKQFHTKLWDFWVPNSSLIIFFLFLLK